LPGVQIFLTSSWQSNVIRWWTKAKLLMTGNREFLREQKRLKQNKIARWIVKYYHLKTGSKGFGGVLHLEKLCFWTCRSSNVSKKQRFVNLICFRFLILPEDENIQFPKRWFLGSIRRWTESKNFLFQIIIWLFVSRLCLTQVDRWRHSVSDVVEYVTTEKVTRLYFQHYFLCSYASEKFKHTGFIRADYFLFWSFLLERKNEHLW
jgi:hypothetical protein